MVQNESRRVAWGPVVFVGWLYICLFPLIRPPLPPLVLPLPAIRNFTFDDCFQCFLQRSFLKRLTLVSIRTSLAHPHLVCSAAVMTAVVNRNAPPAPQVACGGGKPLGDCGGRGRGNLPPDKPALPKRKRKRKRAGNAMVAAAKQTIPRRNTSCIRWRTQRTFW